MIAHHNNLDHNIKHQRIIALDYLRVIAIAILVFYHLGMVWVPDWGFHYKVPTDAHWLQHCMLLFSPWRMGVLWFVSGAALAAMASKYGHYWLLLKRTQIILLPLTVGIMLVVPIQLYVEMNQHGEKFDSVWQFYHLFWFGDNELFQHFSAGIWHHIDVNHLWYLRSLWRYTLLICIAMPILDHCRQHWLTNITAWIVAITLITAVTGFSIDGEMNREVYGLLWLIFGYLAGTNPTLWHWLTNYSTATIIVALVSLLGVQLGLFLMNTIGLETLAEHWQGLLWLNYQCAKALGVLGVLALAAKYCTKESVWVRRANPYVFPVYIVHQSIIVYLAFIMANAFASLWLQITLTLIFTLLACLVVVFIVSRSAVIGLALGKQPLQGHWLTSRAASIICLALCLPVTMRLIGAL